MVKKLISVGAILLFLISGLYAVEAIRSGVAEGDKIGYKLLDQFVSMFQEMAAKGTGGRDKVNNVLRGVMKDAKSAFAEKKLDPVFFHRFTRILMVTKLTIVEDQQGIFGPLIQQEVGSFMKDMTGVEAEVTGKKAVGSIANAIAQGILELHIYLDTKKDRVKLMEEWEKKFKEKSKKKNK